MGFELGIYIPSTTIRKIDENMIFLIGSTLTILLV